MISFQLVFFTTLAVNVWSQYPDFNCDIRDRTLSCFSGIIGRWAWWYQRYPWLVARNRYDQYYTKTEARKSVFIMKIYKFDNNSQLIMESSSSEKYYNLSVHNKEIEHFEPETIYIDENQETFNFTCKHAASRVCVLKRNSTVIERHLYSPYITYTKNAINNIFCCIRIKIYKNIEGTTTMERIIEQFTHILQKPTTSNETDIISVPKFTAAYLGLLVAIPAVLLAAVLIPIVYVCCKKTPQQKPLPNITIPTWEPFYSNRMFQRYSNEGIYILPENNRIYARIKDVRTHQNYYYNYTYNEEHTQSMMKRFSMKRHLLTHNQK